MYVKKNKKIKYIIYIYLEPARYFGLTVCAAVGKARSPGAHLKREY